MATTHPVIIVGSGFSGLGAAIRLKQAGIDFVLLEKADGVGGTWRANHYPGCACDIPSHLYSFSFELNPDWSRHYAPQAEILEYLEQCTDRHGLRPHLRTNSPLETAHWNEADCVWEIEAGGVEYRARWLILALGPFQEPRIPELPGTFDGPQFHTARWDDSVDLRGKRVAVVGTGASAIQVVPEIQPVVEQLTLFQRTPPWVLRRRDEPIPAWRKALFRRVPGAIRAERAKIYWRAEVHAILMTRLPRALQIASRLGRRHLEEAVADPELRRMLTPDYVMGCKRILLSDDYYPALQRPNVEVIPEALSELGPTSVTSSSGLEREIDVLIWATGFHVTDAGPRVEVIGRDGADLAAMWERGPEAYQGLSIAGFPNLSMMLGPNTGLGHNSMVFMIESQLQQVVQAVQMIERGECRSIEVRPEVQRAYNAEIQDQLKGTVWMTGCRSWYVDPDGVNRTMWPDFTWRYWLEMRKLARNHFAIR